MILLTKDQEYKLSKITDSTQKKLFLRYIMLCNAIKTSQDSKGK